jgi:hypothetical protein
VSCPQGQPSPDLASQGAGDDACFVDDGAIVSPPVCGQCQTRPPADVVHCSCRCGPVAGEAPDPAADYCRCSDGFSCEPLIGLGADAGSYCVRDDLPEIECGEVDGFWSPQCAGIPAP